jgi:hypothetical protein
MFGASLHLRFNRNYQCHGHGSCRSNNKLKVPTGTETRNQQSAAGPWFLLYLRPLL